MNKPLISIIIPTLNEEQNIHPLITRIAATIHDPYEILIIDDHSQDNTQRAVKTAILQHKSVRFYQRTKKYGLASAFHYGFAKAKGDIIVLMDANLKHPPEVIPLLLNNLKNHDIAKASRYVSGGGDQSSRLRRGIVRTLNKITHSVLGGPHDYTSLFMAFHRNVLTKIPFPARGFHGEFIVEFLHKAHTTGLSIIEIPFVMQKRGRSKTKASPFVLLHYFKTIYRLAHTLHHG